MLISTILIALFSAFTILFLGKTGLRDAIILRAPSLVSKAFDCDFCLSWWVNLASSMILYLITLPPMGLSTIIICIFIPVLATPLTRLLIC